MGIRQKLRNKIWPAWTPLGYVNDKNARCISPWTLTISSFSSAANYSKNLKVDII